MLVMAFSFLFLVLLSGWTLLDASGQAVLASLAIAGALALILALADAPLVWLPVHDIE